VDDTFFGTDPAELGIGDEMPPCEAPIGDEGGEGAAIYAVGDGVYCLADDLVAAADCEGLRRRSPC
jgi:hypothetical protein